MTLAEKVSSVEAALAGRGTAEVGTGTWDDEDPQKRRQLENELMAFAEELRRSAGDADFWREFEILFSQGFLTADPQWVEVREGDYIGWRLACACALAGGLRQGGPGDGPRLSSLLRLPVSRGVVLQCVFLNRVPWLFDVLSQPVLRCAQEAGAWVPTDATLAFAVLKKIGSSEARRAIHLLKSRLESELAIAVLDLQGLLDSP